MYSKICPFKGHDSAHLNIHKQSRNCFHNQGHFFLPTETPPDSFLVTSFSTPSPWQPLTCFLPLCLVFIRMSFSGITWNVAFHIGLLSRGVMHLESSVLLCTSVPLYFWVLFHCLFICSPVEGYLGCFQFLAIMNKATINIHEQLFVWT